MPNPARAGALIYAQDLDRLSAFYQALLGMRVLKADPEHHVIESADAQLIIHAIPPHIASTFTIASPPVPRDEQAIKLFFTLASRRDASETLERLGGRFIGPVYDGPGFQAQNAVDPEGNIFHLRTTAP